MLVRHYMFTVTQSACSSSTSQLGEGGGEEINPHPSFLLSPWPLIQLPFLYYSNSLPHPKISASFYPVNPHLLIKPSGTPPIDIPLSFHALSSPHLHFLLHEEMEGNNYPHYTKQWHFNHSFNAIFWPLNALKKFEEKEHHIKWMVSLWGIHFYYISQVLKEQLSARSWKI